MKKSKLNTIYILITINIVLSIFIFWPFVKLYQISMEDGFVNPGSTQILKGLYIHEFKIIKRALFYYPDLLLTKIDFNHSNLKTIKLEIDDLDLQRMYANQYSFGKEYVDGRLIMDGDDHKVKFRLSGASNHHVIFPKKSFKLKIKDSSLFGSSVLNFVNPKGLSLMNEYLGNQLANKIGLKTTREEYMNVYINGKYSGFYLVIYDLTKETFERHIQNTLFDYFEGENNDHDFTNYNGNIFQNKNWWKYEIKNKANFYENNQNLSNLLYDIQLVVSDTEERYNSWIELSQSVNTEELGKLLTWLSLIRSYHLDYFHNIRLVYDYSYAKFYLIPWDNVAWHPSWSSHDYYPDFSTNDLFTAFMKNPIFVQEKNMNIYNKLINENISNFVKDQIHSTSDLLLDSIMTNFYNGGGGSRIPITRKDFFNEQKKLIARIDKLIQMIDFLAINTMDVNFEAKSSLQKIQILVSGWSSSEVSALISDSSNCNINNISLYLDYDRNGYISNDDLLVKTNNKGELSSTVELYPGRKFNNDIKILPFDRGPFLEPDKLEYLFLSKELGSRCDDLSLKYRNSITHEERTQKSQIGKIESFKKENFSLHPWTFLMEENKEIGKVKLNIQDYFPGAVVNGNQIRIKSGNYYLYESMVIPQEIDLTFDPGVNIFLKKDVSFISYGKITAMGTPINPISINPLVPGQFFGSFSLIGEEASDSKFDYFNISGGSGDFIDGLYFSGMLSAYHVDNLVVRNSTFKNAQADDALNFKYSNSSVYNSLFEDNSADAIDFDYMSGEISGNTFINNGNDSIDTSGSTTIVQNNYIKSSGDKCISVGEKSYLTITNNILDGCYIGIETKDESEPIITHTIFKDNQVALNAYQKKDFFGSAYPKIYNSVFIDNDQNLTLENSFVGKKLDSDNSEIEVVNSIFDKASKEDLRGNNLEIKNLTNLAWKNNYSLSNRYFPSIYEDRPQNLIDNIVGLSYPNRVPSL